MAGCSCTMAVLFIDGVFLSEITLTMVCVCLWIETDRFFSDQTTVGFRYIHVIITMVNYKKIRIIFYYEKCCFIDNTMRSPRNNSDCVKIQLQNRHCFFMGFYFITKKKCCLGHAKNDKLTQLRTRADVEAMYKVQLVAKYWH